MNREVLEKDFPEEMIKHRPGAYGKLLDYIEIANVIQRLNDSFDAQWSFDIVDQIINENEVVVLGKLTAEGISKMQFGGSAILKSQKSGEPLSLADDLKAAASDAIKKCASHFGVALAIYGRELPPEERTTSRTNGTITPEQLQTIKQIRKEMSISPEDAQALSMEMFKLPITELNRTQASAFINALKRPSPNEPPNHDPPF
jgi:hypothetical protein